MNANGPNANELAAYGVIGTLYAAYFVVRVLYLRMLHQCLNRVHPRNRTLQPGMVWLDLIPLFNYVWGFILVNRVAESLDAEFFDRRIEHDGDDYGQSIGVASNVCQVLGPFTCSLMSIPGLILWVIYWVRIAAYNHELAADGDDFEDYDAPESV